MLTYAVASAPIWSAPLLLVKSPILNNKLYGPLLIEHLLYAKNWTEHRRHNYNTIPDFGELIL